MDHRLLSEHAYAIVNPLRVERSHWADLQASPLIPNGLAARPDAVPLLLDLRTLDDATRIDLLQRADRHDRHYDTPMFSVLLKTDADLPRLQPHLSRQLLQLAPDGKRFLLRWYDSRVFRHLRWLLTPQQMNVLSGPVRAWTWRDGHREWRRHAVPSAPRVLSRLHLTADQYAVLGRIGVLNRTLAQVRRNAPGIALDDAAARLADQYLREAYDVHGLTLEADCRLYAEQGLRHSRWVHEDPQITRRLARVREQRVTYVGACADLDAARLAAPAVQRDLQRKESRT